MKFHYRKIAVFSGCCLLLCFAAGQLFALQAKPNALVADVNVAEPNTQGGIPQIAFEVTEHDFGEVGPLTYNHCKFKFTNTGTGILKIGKIKATCGCTVPELDKKEYSPGESGEMSVRYHTNKRAGNTKKILYVNTNDPNNPRVPITVKAKIVIKIEFKPERLNLSLKDENAGCPNITITSKDNQPFSIKGFKSSGQSITADYDVLEKATSFVLKPKVNMERLGKSLRGNISIDLTHPEGKNISIPFKAMREFEVRPPALMVLKAIPNQPIQRELWVMSNYDEPFEIKAVRSQKGLIKILSQEKSGDTNGYKLQLEITPPPVEEGKRLFTDSLFVDIKDGDKMKVNCRGFYERAKKK